VCSTGACSGTCTPTATRCNGSEAQTCDATGTWQNTQACPVVCSAGACAGSCVTGATQCSAENVQTCNASGSWATTSTCPYVCTGIGVCSGACAPGSKECSGTLAQTCNASGEWQTTQTCPYVCTGAGVCSGVCVPAATQCSGNGVETCSASGQWSAAVACAQPTPVCNQGACACLESTCNGSCINEQTDPNNCGGCGNACQPTGATADTCLGPSCSYTCSANHSDCNADVAPDTDGCECATPGCCGNSCQTAHTNGVGETYYDCNPVSTFTLVTATEACTAFAPTVLGTAANCSSGWTCPGDKNSYVCYGTGSGASLACVDYCWAFATGEAGEVFTCSCPHTSVGSTWK
jgi:hypothetical protein